MFVEGKISHAGGIDYERYGGKRIMTTMVRGMALEGMEGFPVEIEATVIQGQQQMISIIGLGDQEVKESGEWMQVAMTC